MSGPVNNPAIYDQYTLMNVLRIQKTSAPLFWLPTFMKSQINFTTPEIAFDTVYTDDRYLAPFVIPGAQGRGQKLPGYDSRSFKPAYTKIKDSVSPEMFIERQPGEALGTGSLTPDQRRQVVRNQLLARQKTKQLNRQEWLTARAIIDGKVTISGEDYPTTLVDFRRDPSLTIQLTGAAKWDQATGDPMGDLKDARVNANELSGVRIVQHVFGANAWDLFTQRVDLRELQNTLYRGIEASVTRLNDGYGDTMEYMGRIAGLNGAGAIEAWVNTARYVDEAGVQQYYLDQDTVVGYAADSVQGVRCFGMIHDLEAGYGAQDIFAKNWINQDPSVEYLLTQSAPLMIPRQPNATFSMKVK